MDISALVSRFKQTPYCLFSDSEILKIEEVSAIGGASSKILHKILCLHYHRSGNTAKLISYLLQYFQHTPDSETAHNIAKLYYGAGDIENDKTN